MPRELNRLLKSYEFLKNSREELQGTLSKADHSDLEQSLNRLFVDILMHASEDPRVTLAQTRFLMSGLMDLTKDTEKGEVLRDACQRHLDRLQRHLHQGAATTARAVVPSKEERLDPALSGQGKLSASRLQYRYFDSLTDRVAMIDTEYRYIFTNTANARFHGKSAADFVGKPNWQMVGKAYFEKCNKARFDICLAGQSVSFIAPHPLDPSTLFAVNIDPVFDQQQKVESLLVSCRDVSDLPIPPRFVSPLP